ncbi:MAG: helix-turn-helix domain-containing protein [Flavobacterium sp.]|nr:helix-turn-helix domain-containing protein [Flavobacterium sp.]
MENPFEIILDRLDRIEKAILNLNCISDIPDSNQIMNISEVATYIKVAKTTIYGMTHRNTIPHYKNGKKLYFKKSEIDKWIFSKRIKTNLDIENEAMEYIRKNPR